MKKIRNVYKYLIAIIILCIIVVAVVLFNNNSSIFSTNDEIVQYSSSDLKIEFDYPVKWNREIKKGNSATTITLSSDADKSFEIYITGYKLDIIDPASCDENSPCEVAYPRGRYSYKTEQFTTITTLDNKDLQISSLGGVDLQYINNAISDGVLISGDIELGKNYFIYERDTEWLLEDLAIYDYTTDNVRLEIQYSINSASVIEEWDIYEFELKKIISSIRQIN